MSITIGLQPGHPGQSRRGTRGGALLACLLVLSWPPSSQADPETVTLSEVLSRIRSELEATRTASYRVDSWQKQGRKVQDSRFDTWWAGPERIRVEVVDGDDRNSVAVLDGEQVVAWRKGLLGFIKLTLDRYGKMATSVRGNDIGKAGYFDEWRELLALSDRAQLAISGDEWIIHYVDSKGLRTTLWMQPEPLRVLRQEISEGGETVERYRFSQVVINPDLDAGLFSP